MASSKNNSQKLASKLIQSSKNTNSIVHHRWIKGVAGELARRSSGTANYDYENGQVLEFWGGTSTNPWRVHLETE